MGEFSLNWRYLRWNMNNRYTPMMEQFIKDNMHLSDRMMRAEFGARFHWTPSFAGLRKKRQRLKLRKEARTSSDDENDLLGVDI